MIAVEEGHDTLGKNIKNFREARNLSQSVVFQIKRAANLQIILAP